MYLFAHPKNQQANGQTYFNSLWLWGGASTVTPQLKGQLNSDDALFKTLHTPATSSKDTLYVYLDIIKYLKQNKPLKLANFFHNLEQQLAKLNPKNVVIDTAHGEQWRYDGLKKWQIWRNKMPLSRTLCQPNDYGK